MPQNDGKVVMENVRIIFRNFSGQESKYNQEGDRNFCVLLDHDTAKAMAEDGWNVKFLQPREDDEDPEEQPYLPVSVNFKNKPPRIVMITSRGRTPLQEDQVEILDWVDLREVDLIVRPYAWAVNEKSGVKAYLKTLFVTIEEDELEQKYSEMADAPPSEPAR